MGTDYFKELPNNWEIKKFGDVAKITCGVAATPEYVDASIGIPFFSARNVQNGRLDLNYFQYISVELHKKLTKNTKPERGDILLTRVGAGIGEAAVVNIDFEFSVYVSLTLIKCSKKIESEFIKLLLNTNYYRYLATRDQFAGGGVQNLNVQMVKDYPIPVPPLLEQKKIAQILSTWDQAISATEQLIKNSQEQKKALMQQLLTGKKRLLDENGVNFSEEWNEYSLGNLGNTFTGLTGKTKDDFGSGVPYITYMNIFKNSRIDINQVDYVVVKEDEKQNSVRYGDIFFTTSSETADEVGMSSVLLEEVERLYLNSFCFGFRLNNFKVLLPQFAAYILRSSNIRKQISILGQGATRYNLSKNQLMKLILRLPTIAEQKKIAEVLFTADQEIEILQKKLECLKQKKKALMQQLLTGKKRVKVAA